MMSEPWFDPNTFGTWYGAIGGGVGGTLIGCLGGLAGYLGPRGKGRRLVLGSMLVCAGLGVVQLGFGLVALSTGQPYGIWYPLLLIGTLMAVLMGGLFPMIRLRYSQAEHRRLEAEAIRKS
jgi:hypothetical protein